MQDLINGWKVSKDGVERDKIEQALRDALKSEFNDRLTAHEREIKELEAKVRELRNRLNLRREKQDEIVDHRLQQILREAQGLGWGSESQGRGYGWAYGEAGMAGEYGGGRGGYGAGGYDAGGYGGYETFSSAQDVPMSPLAPQTAPSALEPVPVETSEERLSVPEPAPGRN